MGSGQLVCWSVLYKFMLQGHIALNGRWLEYKVHTHIYIYASQLNESECFQLHLCLLLVT